MRERLLVAQSSWRLGRVTGWSTAGTISCLAVLLSATVNGQELPLQSLIDAAREKAGAPGAILGVELAGAPPLVVASGYVDLAHSEAIQASQPFFLGSVSKTYTAVVTLRLVEERLLSLDDTLDRWLPGFPRAGEVSIRQLLDHTSGLKDFYSFLYFRPDRDEMIEYVTKAWTEAELLELSGRLGHWFDPGTDWAYSSTNYYLLGVVVERASGFSLAQAYRRYILTPLSLDRTWLTRHEPASGSLPVGHLGPVDGWPHSSMFGDLGATTVLDTSPVEWGAGGLAATAAEGLRFLGALMRGGPLADSSLAQMSEFRATPPLGVHAPSQSGLESADGYGLGLITMSRAGLTVIGHGGLFTGHTAGLWFVPACDAAISIYFNRGFVGQRGLLDEVLGLLAQQSEDEACELVRTTL